MKIRIKKRRRFSSSAFLFLSVSAILKKLQLLYGLVQRCHMFAIKEFHIAKLLVGYSHYTHLTKFRQHPFHALDMHIGIFCTWAMTQIDGKLKHSKTILQEFLAEFRCRFPLLLGFGWQIKKHQHPHNSIFAKT